MNAYDGFYIVKSDIPGDSDLFLKGNRHCHGLSSLEKFVASERFCANFPDLVPVFKDAIAMIKDKNIQGPVIQGYSKAD